MCGALYARANENENCAIKFAGVGEKHLRAPASVAPTVKVHTVSGDLEEIVFYIVGRRRSRLTTTSD
jgi:hypothetical protein